MKWTSEYEALSAQAPVSPRSNDIHPTLSSLVSRAARTDEQGRVHGAASVMESLGRTVGPVWGAASLQRVGDAMPYASAAGLLLAVMALSAGYQAGERDSAGTLSGPV
jgi:predicted MFS family arabinose efflux permease